MARPNKTEKRDQQLNLKLTIRELAWLRARAASVGMRPVDFGRAQLLSDRPVQMSPRNAAPHLDPLFIAQMSRIGNNLNQISRNFHRFQLLEPSDLQPILQAIREIIRKASENGA
jgi:hypothetical protein